MRPSGRRPERESDVMTRLEQSDSCSRPRGRISAGVNLALASAAELQRQLKLAFLAVGAYRKPLASSASLQQLIDAIAV